MERISVVNNAQNILDQVRQVIVGKDKALSQVLAAMLAGGHVLLEDIPGVGKTSMALAFSKTLGLRYNRLQFTPDVLPSDVTGYSVLNQADGSMRYQPGAVLCNLFLADELNRATSRTQSALLEAMEEGQVTVDGVTHKLPEPFTVIATQNPVGAAGTQLLPDSQLDRFMICLSLGYPGAKDEIAMVAGRQKSDPMENLETLVTADVLVQMQQLVRETFVAEDIISYVVTLIHATRGHELILRGASPRGTLAVVDMAKAVARLCGRDYVVPRDVQDVFIVTVAHRLLLSPKAQGQGMQAQQILQEILRKIPAPTLV